MAFRSLVLSLVPFFMAVSAQAADLTGTWSAKFDTQVGPQDYTYTLTQNGSELTGSIKSGNGETTLESGAVEGDTVTFVENLTIMGMTIKVDYTGKIVSDKEIAFTRQVGTFATEQLTATRVK